MSIYRRVIELKWLKFFPLAFYVFCLGKFLFFMSRMLNDCFIPFNKGPFEILIMSLTTKRNGYDFADVFNNWANGVALGITDALMLLTIVASFFIRDKRWKWVSVLSGVIAVLFIVCTVEHYTIYFPENP